MLKYFQPKDKNKTKADCKVEFQRIDPETKDRSWEEYERMTIQAPSIEHLMERAHLYLGKPERYDNVEAIRLTGTITVLNHEKDLFYDHEDTFKVNLNILRERTKSLFDYADTPNERRERTC